MFICLQHKSLRLVDISQFPICSREKIFQVKNRGTKGYGHDRNKDRPDKAYTLIFLTHDLPFNSMRL